MVLFNLYIKVAYFSQETVKKPLLMQLRAAATVYVNKYEVKCNCS